MRKITSPSARLAGALALASAAVALVATLRSADHGDAPLIAANRAATRLELLGASDPVSARSKTSGAPGAGN